MRKIKLFAVIALVALSLSSCKLSSFDTTTILTAPQMNAANQEIQKSLALSVGEAFELVYPRFGNYQNAIVTIDINGNGENEAICFYTTSQDQKVNFTVLETHGGEWHSHSMSHSQSAAQIDRVDFFDYNGDGIKEIVVGWQYTSGEEKALEIFEYGKDSKLKSLYTGLYNNLVVFENSVVAISKNATGKTASATLVGKKGSSVGIVGTAALNNAISGIINVQQSILDDKYKVIFVDEQLENSMFTTEIISVNSKGDISNISAQFNAITSRNTPIICTDVNGDSIPDIPIEKKFPSYKNADKTENLYYVDWYGISSDGAKRIVSAYTSTNEQFLLAFPDKWVDNITVQKDSSSDRQINFFMLADDEKIPMFSLRVFSRQEFLNDIINLGWQSFYESDENVYAFKSDSSQLPEEFTVDINLITQLFKILS